MAEYRLSPAAELDVEEIWLYTRQHWGTDQADRYVEKLTNAFAELTDAPRSAPSCDQIKIGYRRLFIDRHSIYFRLTENDIVIVRVLHIRMDASRHLDN